MRPKAVAYVAAVIAVALLAVAAFELGILPVGPSGPGMSSVTACTGCVPNETVVDLLMPAIGPGENATNPNRILNVSAGTSRTLEVDVYPTAALTFSFGFASYSVSGSSQGSSPAATFQPRSISVEVNQKGVTYMNLTISSATPAGVYDSVVSAVNVDNSTQVWGLYFEIVVS